ncbi:MAG: GTP cyclohydrolase II, partial [Arenibacterium sp.]
MSLSPDTNELLARARADLRMGLPVVLHRDGQALVFAALETVSAEKSAALRGSVNAPCLVITARRAETLKARAYDGDLARVEVPETADVTWMRAI